MFSNEQNEDGRGEKEWVVQLRGDGNFNAESGCKLALGHYQSVRLQPAHGLLDSY
jgi:hypothetical protein